MNKIAALIGLTVLFSTVKPLMAIGMTPSTTVVTIADKKLESTIRSAINVPYGDITSDKMSSITTLLCDLDGIYSLDGLQYCTNLVNLNLDGNDITDLSPLSELTKLESLSLKSNESLSDISYLKNLINLKSLDLGFTSVSELSPVEKLINLNYLCVSYSNISNINSLRYLTKLQTLHAWHNSIADIEPLKECANLKEISLDTNKVVNIEPLKECTNLEVLNLNANKIVDISPLESLHSIKNLNLCYNNIVDLEPLKNSTTLTELYVDKNKIVDVSSLSNLSNLTQLSLESNLIDDIEGIQYCTSLTHLWLDNNKISKLDKFKGIKDLEMLSLECNSINDITPLSELKNLKYLILADNYIQDISTLYGRKFKYFDVKYNDITDISGFVNLDFSDIEFDDYILRFTGNFIDMSVQKNLDVKSYLDSYGIKVGNQHRIGVQGEGIIKNGKKILKFVTGSVSTDLANKIVVSYYLLDGSTIGHLYLDNKVNIDYYSDDNSIATVDDNGVVTGLKAGKTKIWAIYSGINSNYTKGSIDVEFTYTPPVVDPPVTPPVVDPPVTPPVVDPPVTPPVVDPPVKPPVVPPKNNDSGGGIQEIIKNTRGTILGRVLNKGKSIEGVEVTLLINGKKVVQYTDTEGKYEFKDLEFGNYTIIIRKDGKYSVKVVVVK